MAKSKLEATEELHKQANDWCARHSPPSENIVSKHNLTNVVSYMYIYWTSISGAN